MLGAKGSTEDIKYSDRRLGFFCLAAVQKQCCKVTRGRLLMKRACCVLLSSMPGVIVLSFWLQQGICSCHTFTQLGVVYPAVGSHECAARPIPPVYAALTALTVATLFKLVLPPVGTAATCGACCECRNQHMLSSRGPLLSDDLAVCSWPTSRVSSPALCDITSSK